MTLEATALCEETVEGIAPPVLVTVDRRGYAWSLALGSWTDAHRAWLAARRCSSKRMLSQDVAAFMDAFREELDVGQIAVVPFDDGGEVTVILPFSPGLDWFAGLASEAAAAR